MTYWSHKPAAALQPCNACTLNNKVLSIIRTMCSANFVYCAVMTILLFAEYLVMPGASLVKHSDVNKLFLLFIFKLERM